MLLIVVRAFVTTSIISVNAIYPKYLQDAYRETEILP